MGKRIANGTAVIEANHHHNGALSSKTLAKRKCNTYLNDHESRNDEDSLINNTHLPNLTSSLNFDIKLQQFNNTSHLLNASLQANSPSITSNNNNNNNNQNSSAKTESPKPIYTLRPSIVNGTILNDLTRKSWRLGRPIGKIETI